MDADMKPNQLARLLPETVRAVMAYRRHIKRTTGERVSINAALNALILLGWARTMEHESSKTIAGGEK
jgi:hypothetical protein